MEDWQQYAFFVSAPGYDLKSKEFIGPVDEFQSSMEFSIGRLLWAAYSTMFALSEPVVFNKTVFNSYWTVVNNVDGGDGFW